VLSLETTTAAKTRRARGQSAIRGGTGNIGGKLSDKSKAILEKYIQITNQDKKVLEHIKYEVRK